MNHVVAQPATKVLAIVGPTASGKSDIAVKVALRLGSGEIISADSMQVYREMDIGTAKPDHELTGAVPHHLLDILDPSDDFSAAQYQEVARVSISEVAARGELPILVGGSGLYVRAALDRLTFPADQPGSDLRAELEELGRADMDALVEVLRTVDPAALEHVDLKNPRRVTRAIEAARRTGKTFTDRHENWHKRHSVFNLLMVGLRLPRERLVNRIERRVDAMISAGLEDEARALTERERGISSTAAQALGYKEFFAYFRNERTLAESIELIKTRTRQFSKRQMTWFRAETRINWIDLADGDSDAAADRILELVMEKRFIVN